MLGTWLWMGLVLYPGTFPNNCDVLSGGDLPHKSHLLSTECPYFPILFVSFTLLHTFPFHVRYNYGDIPNKCVLYYDSTVGCHTPEYTIFAAIAVCVLVIFIISSTILLILYPTKLLRKCVSCCGFRSWHALHVCGIISGTVQGWNQWYS